MFILIILSIFCLFYLIQNIKNYLNYKNEIHKTNQDNITESFDRLARKKLILFISIFLLIMSPLYLIINLNKADEFSIYYYLCVFVVMIQLALYGIYMYLTSKTYIINNNILVGAGINSPLKKENVESYEAKKIY